MNTTIYRKSYWKRVIHAPIMFIKMYFISRAYNSREASLYVAWITTKIFLKRTVRKG